MQAVQEELVKLPSIISTGSGEKIAAAGRSFDTYNSRPTVATAKGMGDWVDMKGEPAKQQQSVVDGGASAGEEAGGSLAERRRRRRMGGGK